MTTSQSNPAPRVVVEVSDDHMLAWVRPGGPQAQSFLPDEILAALKEKKIVITDAVRECVEAFDRLLEEDSSGEGKVLVAEGKPPVPGKNGEFLWADSLEEEAESWQDDAPVNYYTANMIVTVDKDMVLGRLVPPVMGEDGVDVYGKAVPPRFAPKGIHLDDSVRRSEEDAQVILSNVAGKIIYKDGKLGISEVIDIHGDVNFDSGSVDSAVDVKIWGTIRENFEVKSEHSITVGGAIEAAKVTAGTDITVRGGILGRGHGDVKAGGSVIAKFVDDGHVRADCDIKIAKEVMNSHLRCEGTLLAAQGSLIGGDVYARQGIEAGSLGSEAFIPTFVCVGIHPDVLREADRIQETMKTQRQAVEKIRETVQPLMANLKRLTPSQKEAATELLFKAEAAEAEISEAETRREEMLEAARPPSPPFVFVSKTIHPGVTIRIGRRQVVFSNEYKGPVRIEKRKVRSVTEIVAVNKLSGSITILKSADVVDEHAAGAGDSKQGGELKHAGGR